LIHPTCLIHPNRPGKGVCTDFGRSGLFQPRFKRFQNHWKGNWTGKKNTSFSKYKFHNNNFKKYWEKGESSNQGHWKVNRRFEPQVEFTIPDLARSEITANRKLKGPHP
jgi:hypothetical protein